MNNLPKKLGNAFVSLAIAAGLTGFASMAQSQNEHHRLGSATVRATQKKLKDDGLYKGNVDGAMGPRTRAALRQYQEQHKLSPDGRLTRRTAESLGVAGPGAYFESAGGAVANGSKSMASRMKHGEVGSGVEQFGKGVGHGAKDVGAGTAKGAKDVYRGTKHAVDPHSDKK